MWLILSLLTALFTSCQDIIAKRTTARVGTYMTAWAWMFFSVPFFLCLLPWHGPVTLKHGFWLSLLVGGSLLTVSGITFFKAIEAGELSLTLPLLSLTPLFMLVTSPLIVGEFPHPGGIAGMLCIMAGAGILFTDPADGGPLGAFRRLWRARGSRYMLMTAVLFSVGGNIDKVGVLHSSPLIWSIALNTFVSIGIGAVMVQRTPGVWGKLRAEFPALLGIGFFAALMMLAQMTALTLAPAAYVIAIKRTSILMSSLAGYWIFRERAAVQRVPAILLMVAGVFIIAFFS